MRTNFLKRKTNVFKGMGCKNKKKHVGSNRERVKKWVAKKISFGFKRKGNFEKAHEGQLFWLVYQRVLVLLWKQTADLKLLLRTVEVFWMETFKRPVSDSGNVLDRKLTEYEYDLKNKNIQL